MAESRQRESSHTANQSKQSEEQQADERMRETLLKADTFTNAPKVSRKTTTKEEREVIAKQQEEEHKEAEKLAKTATKGAIGRWWTRVQSGPNKVTFAMAVVALGVVYGDIGTSPLYTMQTFLAGQGGIQAVRARVGGVRCDVLPFQHLADSLRQAFFILDQQ